MAKSSLKIKIKDIFQIKADAIVIPCSPEPTNYITGSQDVYGICKLMYDIAGREYLQQIRQGKVIPFGEAFVCDAHDYQNAKYIIQTATPSVAGSFMAVSELENCYWNSLKAAKEQGCKSVVFPLLGSGVCRFPVEDALEIAKKSIEVYLTNEKDMKVTLAISYATNIYLLDTYLKDVTFEETQSWEKIQEAYEDAKKFGIEYDPINELHYRMRRFNKQKQREEEAQESSYRSLQEYMKQHQDASSEVELSFADYLNMAYVDSGLSYAEIGKRAGYMDVKNISNYLAGKNTPGKDAALRLGIALNITAAEMKNWMKALGYAFAENNLDARRDLIILYYMEKNEKYFHTKHKLDDLNWLLAEEREALLESRRKRDKN